MSAIWLSTVGVKHPRRARWPGRRVWCGGSRKPIVSSNRVNRSSWGVARAPSGDVILCPRASANLRGSSVC